MERASIGFTTQDHRSDGMEAIKRLFTPEFRNRLDAIIQFKPLDPTVVALVVNKFIYQLEAQLADRNVTIDIEEAARLWLAEKGYDPKMGARPMERVMQDYIKRPLADELLFGRLVHGGHVEVRLQDNAIALEIVTEEESA